MDMDTPSIARMIYRVLRDTQDSARAMSRGELSELCGCSVREVRAALGDLRRDGVLVVADEQGGYRLATSTAEVEAYTARLKRRVQALREICDAMDQAAACLWGQRS